MNEKDVPHLLESVLGDGQPPPMSLSPVLDAGKRSRRRAVAFRYAGGGVLTAALVAGVAIPAGLLPGGAKPPATAGGSVTVVQTTASSPPDRPVLPPELCPQNAKDNPPSTAQYTRDGAFPTADEVVATVRQFITDHGLALDPASGAGEFKRDSAKTDSARLAATFQGPDGAKLWVEAYRFTGAPALVYATYLRDHSGYSNCTDPELVDQASGWTIRFAAPVGTSAGTTQYAQFVSRDGFTVNIGGGATGGRLLLTPDQAVDLALLVGALPRR